MLQSLVIPKTMTVAQLRQLAPGIVSGMHRDAYLKALGYARYAVAGGDLGCVLGCVVERMLGAFAGADVLLTDAGGSFVLTINYA